MKIPLLFLFLLMNFAAYSQTTIGAGGGMMITSFDKNQNLGNLNDDINLNTGFDYIPSLSCFVETEWNSRVSGILKIHYSKLKAEYSSNFIRFEISSIPLEFTQISAIPMINLKLLKRDKKKYFMHRINLGLGGGVNHYFNLIPENEFLFTADDFESTDSWEYSLNYEISIDIKNLRIGIHNSIGKANARSEGLIERSRFSTVTGSYILEL